MSSVKYRKTSGAGSTMKTVVSLKAVMMAFTPSFDFFSSGRELVVDMAQA